MSKKKPTTADEPLSFEASLAELEEIVAKLEGGSLELGESIAAYETGVKRLRGCYDLLVAAERRIVQVQSVDENGKPRTVPLEDAGSGDLPDKSDSRSRRRTAAARPAGDRVDDESSLF